MTPKHQYVCGKMKQDKFVQKHRIYFGLIFLFNLSRMSVFAGA